MECIVCYREVSAANSGPGKDWIACQACGQVVCLQCASNPASELCDVCIERYDVDAELIIHQFRPADSPAEFDTCCP